MAERNYNTTTKTPYPRVVSINIHYPANGIPEVSYVEQMAIVDASGAVHHLADCATTHPLDLLAILQPVRAVDPSTGADIPGMTFTSDAVMVGLLAFLRADQKRRDAL